MVRKNLNKKTKSMYYDEVPLRNTSNSIAAANASDSTLITSNNIIVSDDDSEKDEGKEITLIKDTYDYPSSNISSLNYNNMSSSNVVLTDTDNEKEEVMNVSPLLTGSVLASTLLSAILAGSGGWKPVPPPYDNTIAATVATIAPVSTAAAPLMITTRGEADDAGGLASTSALAMQDIAAPTLDNVVPPLDGAALFSLGTGIGVLSSVGFYYRARQSNPLDSTASTALPAVKSRSATRKGKTATAECSTSAGKKASMLSSDISKRLDSKLSAIKSGVNAGTYSKKTVSVTPATSETNATKIKAASTATTNNSNGVGKAAVGATIVGALLFGTVSAKVGVSTESTLTQSTIPTVATSKTTTSINAAINAPTQPSLPTKTTTNILTDASAYVDSYIKTYPQLQTSTSEYAGNLYHKVVDKLSMEKLQLPDTNAITKSISTVNINNAVTDANAYVDSYIKTHPELQTSTSVYVGNLYNKVIDKLPMEKLKPKDIDFAKPFADLSRDVEWLVKKYPTLQRPTSEALVSSVKELRETIAVVINNKFDSLLQSRPELKQSTSQYTAQLYSTATQLISNKIKGNYDAFLTKNPEYKQTTAEYVSQYSSKVNADLEQFAEQVAKAPLGQGLQRLADQSTSEFTSNIVTATADALSKTLEPSLRPVINVYISEISELSNSYSKLLEDSAAVANAVIYSNQWSGLIGSLNQAITEVRNSDAIRSVITDVASELQQVAKDTQHYSQDFIQNNMDL